MCPKLGHSFPDVEELECSTYRKKKGRRVYDCHPFSSWERGSNENQNRLIRRFISKGTSLKRVSGSLILHVEDWINRYPRKIHGYRSAEQMFQEQLAVLEG